jgi:hypothetical protein
VSRTKIASLALLAAVVGAGVVVAHVLLTVDPDPRLLDGDA